jgi:hypothetical protein
MILQMQDLHALERAAIQHFEAGLMPGPLQDPNRISEYLARLEAELEQIYRVVVLLQKNESDMTQAAEIWRKMVNICDSFARQVSALGETLPSARVFTTGSWIFEVQPRSAGSCSSHDPAGSDHRSRASFRPIQQRTQSLLKRHGGGNA